MPKITFTSDANAYRITLSDPPLNILDVAMLDELRDAIARVAHDRHALIIDAQGEKAFSAGASVQDHLGDRAATMLGHFHDCFRMLAKLDVVTIALVRGAALGGGCELALGCDFVLASDRAKFSQPEINLGVFPPVAAYQFSRQLAPRKGLELLLTGDTIDAATAERLGLVNAVFPFAEFDAKADEWMGRLYRQSASSLRLAKCAFRLAQSKDFNQRLGDVERLYLDELMLTSDANEGLNAFLEKRKPVWSGR
ncbi:MAG TPA: enoyl-CoA hydratase/isomerase family protein [Thermoanaerobaculia bacterium]|jgi:cyclohexa-1,5-dienecarbonyl-CoA hydratase|nr:enoyl-CoA hydratase/isomerase family protein [Thermoanaerobaculia bacterium]